MRSLLALDPQVSNSLKELSLNFGFLMCTFSDCTLRKGAFLFWGVLFSELSDILPFIFADFLTGISSSLDDSELSLFLFLEFPFS